MTVECEMRRLSLEMALRIPSAARHAKEIFDELQLGDCQDFYSTQDDHQTPISSLEENTKTARTLKTTHPHLDTTITIHLDCQDGNDHHNGMSKDQSLRTPHAAQKAARSLLNTAITKVVILVNQGICELSEPLVLSFKDSNVDWRGENCDAQVIFSGGVVLSNLNWIRYRQDKHIWVASLPDHLNASAIDGLFALPGERHRGPFNIDRQVRLTRARYPNGNSEQDQMPTGYTKLGGAQSSVEAWRVAGNVSKRFKYIKKENTTIYPWFGHSRDVRWVMDYHEENDNTSYYDLQHQFWRPRIGTAAKYNVTTFSPRVGNWTIPDAVLHVIHYSWWGNWQWHLDSINETTTSFEFGKGGWQDAHGGGVVHNYFFIENILEELDSPGEWYVDSKQRLIYYWPIEAQRQREYPKDWTIVASQIPCITHFRGTSSENPAHNITFHGITFAHTTTAFLKQRYTVPSAGDWSVLPQGSVTIENAENISLLGCNFIQVNGNAVVITKHARYIRLEDGDFQKIGDSGVVVVGELPLDRPYLFDETNITASTIPRNITIARNHFGQVGVFGKQTSALFIAISQDVTFERNVLYHGPRAGVNINDGFGGGHVLKGNVIFNQVLESGDHGPINTWSRSAYQYKDLKNDTTTIPKWNHISQNLIMLGPRMGSLYGPGNGPCSNGDPEFYCPKNGGSLYTCLDHDDGSDYYLDRQNVCVFAGMKNYLGQNKIWDNNLIVYPEGANSQNRTGMPCLWTSMNLPVVNNETPYCMEQPCRTREVFINNDCVTAMERPLEYDMFDKMDLQKNGPWNTTIPFTAGNRYFLRNTTDYYFDQWNLTEAQRHGVDVNSTTQSWPSARQIADMARNLLGI